MSNNGTPENLREMRKEAQEVAREAYGKADGARKDAVKRLFEVADDLRSQARQTSGEARDDMNTIARNLERTANDVNSRALDSAEDAVKMAQENPYKLLAMIFAVGLVIGWWLNGNN
jgi:ElaB/YqjD/DUF883 family membrane-anchored ribosome-binding protein